MGLTFKIPVSEAQMREKNKNAESAQQIAAVRDEIEDERQARHSDDESIVDLLDKHKDEYVAHLNDADCHGGILHKNWIFATDIEIPHSGWVAQYEPNGYGYTIDVAVPESAITAVPTLTFEIGSLLVAQAAEVCGTCLASDGFIRLWAKNIPASNLLATLKLSYPGGTPDLSMNILTTTTVVSSTIPTASKFSIGGVKVQTGSGLEIDNEGNLSLSPATLAQIVALMSANS